MSQWWLVSVLEDLMSVARKRGFLRLVKALEHAKKVANEEVKGELSDQEH